MKGVTELFVEGDLDTPDFQQRLMELHGKGVNVIATRNAVGLKLRVWGENVEAALKAVSFQKRGDESCDLTKAHPERLFRDNEDFVMALSRLSSRRGLLGDLLEDTDSSASDIIEEFTLYFSAAIPVAIYGGLKDFAGRKDITKKDFEKAVLQAVVLSYPFLSESYFGLVDVIFRKILEEKMNVVFGGDLDYK